VRFIQINTLYNKCIVAATIRHVVGYACDMRALTARVAKWC